MTLEVGDHVFFYEWTTENNQNSHTKFRAVVRTIPGNPGNEVPLKIHLRSAEGETGPSGFRNINNVDYIEERDPRDMDGEDYWKFDRKAET